MTIQTRQRPPMRYQNEYVWLVFVSALDVMFTWKILEWGGVEVNWVARTVIGRFGLPGMVMFKFALVVLVIVICEVVGRQRDRLGRSFARISIALSGVPVAMGAMQLFAAAWAGRG